MLTEKCGVLQMTLDESITYYRDKAEELKIEAEQLREMGDRYANPHMPYNEPVKHCRECADIYAQQAKWLEELQQRREADKNIKIEIQKSIAYHRERGNTTSIEKDAIRYTATAHGLTLALNIVENSEVVEDDN